MACVWTAGGSPESGCECGPKIGEKHVQLFSAAERKKPRCMSCLSLRNKGYRNAEGRPMP
jgi:hypothetical protein